MNQRIIGLLLTFAILIAMPLQSYAATPKETITAGVNEVLAALAEPAFKSKDRDQKISEISSIIGKIFDIF